MLALSQRGYASCLRTRSSWANICIFGGGGEEGDVSQPVSRCTGDRPGGGGERERERELGLRTEKMPASIDLSGAMVGGPPIFLSVGSAVTHGMSWMDDSQ